MRDKGNKHEERHVGSDPPFGLVDKGILASNAEMRSTNGTPSPPYDSRVRFDFGDVDAGGGVSVSYCLLNSSPSTRVAFSSPLASVVIVVVNSFMNKSSGSSHRFRYLWDGRRPHTRSAGGIVLRVWRPKRGRWQTVCLCLADQNVSKPKCKKVPKVKAQTTNG